MPVDDRRRLALGTLALALVAIVLVALSPLREPSGDITPGRVGGLTLRCGGTFDLDRIDWLHAETMRNSRPYYVLRDEQKQFTSLFGPLPAIASMIALSDFGDGDTISDTSLRNRERTAASVLLALSLVLLVLASVRYVSWQRALLAGGIAALSYAGMATIGQGLWQATVALPLLVGALATIAWRERCPRLALVTPALLLFCVMTRPVIAPLAIALGIQWALVTRTQWRIWAVAAAIALVAVIPLAIYNMIHIASPLPMQQWVGNKKMTDEVFSISLVPKGVAGLLVSPARGLVWFAPIAILGIVLAFVKKQHRVIAIGVFVQIVFMAAFFKWHGGQAYGPRLLIEATWICIFLALGAGLAVRNAIWMPLAAITILVGQLGLWRWLPEQWERRRLPDRNTPALWDFTDSPIQATFFDPDPRVKIGYDSPPVSSWRCENGRLFTTK